jgi:hypothetical protein
MVVWLVVRECANGVAVAYPRSVLCKWSLGAWLLARRWAAQGYKVTITNQSTKG